MSCVNSDADVIKPTIAATAQNTNLPAGGQPATASVTPTLTTTQNKSLSVINVAPKDCPPQDCLPMFGSLLTEAKQNVDAKHKELTETYLGEYMLLLKQNFFKPFENLLQEKDKTISDQLRTIDSLESSKKLVEMQNEGVRKVVGELEQSQKKDKEKISRLTTHLTALRAQNELAGKYEKTYEAAEEVVKAKASGDWGKIGAAVEQLESVVKEARKGDQAVQEQAL